MTLDEMIEWLAWLDETEWVEPWWLDRWFDRIVYKSAWRGLRLLRWTLSTVRTTSGSTDSSRLEA